MKKLIVAVAALALMAGSAYAAEWNFYGSARVSTFWSETDVIDGPSGDWDYAEALNSTARIGANVKVSDELSARFEYGAANDNANIRLLYGEWDFGAGKLLIGKDYTPINVTYSSQVYSNDTTLGGYGDFDNCRHPQIKLTFDGFQIAFIDTDESYDSMVTYDTQSLIPMIAVSYTANFDMGEVMIAGGFNTFEVNDDEDIHSYGIGIGTKLNFGALGMFATFVYGENLDGLGTGTGTGFEGLAVYDGTDVDDCESIGGTIGVYFTVNDMLTLEGGYGYIHDEMDEANVTSIAQSYYLQAAITLAPGVIVTPEIGMLDGREAGEDEEFYFGAKWQINF